MGEIACLLDTVHSMDESLFLMINHTRNGFLDWLMVRISDFGLFAPLIGAFLLYRFIRGSNRERAMWLAGILAIIASDALCARVIKPLVGRMRPYLSLDHIYVYKSGKWILTTPEFREAVKKSLSFPSCHATNMWTAAFFIWGWNRLYALPVFLLAFLVSYSRIYLGVHYPLDCLGGMLVGLLWGTLIVLIVKRMIRLWNNVGNEP